MIRNLVLGIVIYYVLVNIVLFGLFFVDKRKAIKNKWRISERTLLVVGLLGGGAGGLASMKLTHHKTRKTYFYIVYVCGIVIHVFALYEIFKLVM